MEQSAKEHCHGCFQSYTSFLRNGSSLPSESINAFIFLPEFSSGVLASDKGIIAES